MDKKRRQLRWLYLLLLGSLAANLILLTGVLYLRVPAVHQALLPTWRVVRNLVAPPAESDLPTPSAGETPAATSSTSPWTIASGELLLSLSEDKTTATLLLPKIQDDERYTIRLDGGASVELDSSVSTFVWRLHDGASHAHANRAMIYVQDLNQEAVFIGEIELYRVSESEAWEQLNTQRENGWVFLGRCTFDLVGGTGSSAVIGEEIVTLQWLDESEQERIRGLFPSLVNDIPLLVFDELVEGLSELSTAMCIAGLRNISASNNAAIYEVRPGDAMVGVSRGSIGVQCQGLRSVFAWIAISGGWLDARDLREVDLYRYAPIEGIDVNSHAILEVRVPDGDWMALDPLAQAVFVDSSGFYLSASEIRTLRDQDMLGEIDVVSLGEFCVSSEISYYSQDEEGFWQGTDFSDRDPYNYNYWSQFDRLVYRHLELPTE